MKNTRRDYKKKGRLSHGYPPHKSRVSPELVQSKSQESHPEDKVQVKVKEEDKEESSSPDKNIYELYEENIGALTEIISEELKAAEELFTEKWVKDAIREAVRANKKSWRYIAGILENWKKDGRGKKIKKDDPDKYIKGHLGHMVNR